MAKFDRDSVLRFIGEAAGVVASLEKRAAEIEAIGERLVAALRAGGKVLTAGNGGSAAEAMHLAEELTGKYHKVRKALPAIALVADGTALTCIANDWSFDYIFARQVEAFAKPGDLLVLFSTSGNSENLLRAAAAMKAAGGVTVALLGKGGGKLPAVADVALVIDSNHGGHVQEAHQVILHLLLELVDAAFA